MRRLATGRLAVLAVLLAIGIRSDGAPAARRPPLRARAVTWNEAQPIVDRLADSLPATLREIPPPERPGRWPAWRDSARQAVLARLARGEEDSLVNLLLFGTSFTTQPRVTPAFVGDLERRWQAGTRDEAAAALSRAYTQRASDLVSAAATRVADPRLRFARSVLEGRGFRLSTGGGRSAAVAYLLRSVVRVQQEASALADDLAAVRGQTDSTAAFAERSRLFRGRGLAPDSSVMTQYAVDRAIQTAGERRLLAPGGVRGAAIVGPGLDFVDKQEGHDFYPPQSLQPFALIDSLLRWGLAAPGALAVTTLDVSASVNGHLREAVDRARRLGRPYRLVLPLAGSPGTWLGDAAAYWNRAGDRIGSRVAVGEPRGVAGVRVRGVDVTPATLARLHVVDANVVYERVEVAAGEGFDLVVASNVLVYYDTFEQTLALANLAAMLRRGGLLITNNALLEIPEVPMRSASYVTVPFSPGEGDGEHMVFYQKK